jgi:glycosyltransferase involved in cell wall biosynthesis
MNISIVIPARNEEETLGKVLLDLNRFLSTYSSHTFEVICVDDHSNDRTVEVAHGFGARVITNRRSPGKGMALRAGFEAARGNWILMMDADYSHRPEDIAAFVAAAQDGVGLVIGSRVFGGSEEYNHVRALGNVFLSATLGLCTGRYLSDALNGFKLFRRDVFTDFEYTSSSFEIEIEIIANALRKGYRVVEVVSHERARAGGEMKSRVVRHGFRFLFRILWEGLRGVAPLSEKAPGTLPASAKDKASAEQSMTAGNS